MKNLVKVLGLVLALALIAAACGDSAEDTTTTAAAAETTTTAAAETTTTAAAETTTTAAAETTTTAAAEVTPLLIWADETRTPVLQSVAADFEAATGVPLDIQLVGFGDIRSNMVQQGPLGEGADVFIGAHDWIGELAVNGIVEPVQLGTRSEEFFDVSLDAFSFEGQLYGLPYANEAIGLYRNTDLVPDAPASWEELLATCETLGDTVEQCIALPAGDAYHHYPFLATTGGYIFAYDPENGYDVNDIGIASEGAIEGFTVFNQLVADGVLNPDVDYGTMTNLFFNGQAAYMWTGPWALPDVQAAGVNYAVSPLPTIAGNTAVPFVGVQGFFVNAFSDQKALAQTLVLDYLAREDIMVELYNVGFRAPAHIAAFDAVKSDPDVEQFGISASAGQPMPNVPEMSAVWDNFGNAVSEIYNQAGDPAGVLATAATAVRETIGSS